jgi:hypothetical protein
MQLKAKLSPSIYFFAQGFPSSCLVRIPPSECRAQSHNGNSHGVRVALEGKVACEFLWSRASQPLFTTNQESQEESQYWKVAGAVPDNFRPPTCIHYTKGWIDVEHTCSRAGA